MPLHLLAILASAQFTPIEMRSGFVVANVTQGGRNPAPRDLVADEYARTGRIGLSGKDIKWGVASADPEGWFNNIGGGYLLVQANVDQPRSAILEATGHSMVYVNGEPRGGDPYAYGYVQTPIELEKGINTFVFAGGRGRVKAKLTFPHSAQQFATADPTIPDMIPSDHGDLFGGIVVVNNSDEFARGLVISAKVGKSSADTKVPPIPPLTTRKVRFDFPVVTDEKMIGLSLRSKGKVIDSGTVNIRSRKEGEQYMRTFESAIDGSVQYYAVVPALKPSAGNSLVLTLHGASVEAIGQAQAYLPKPDITIVAPTNRRPYGFDWEDWGRMDAMEVLQLAKSEFPHDPLKVFLTGHSMGGHGTWSVGSMYPFEFGAIAPSEGWISFWSYAGGWDPKDPTSAESTVRQSMDASDTLMRGKNLGSVGVYILHGDKDDNVPVEEARAMKKYLEPWHAPIGYHEEPGAGHWWGNQCVDWPDIFTFFADHPREVNPPAFEFVTPNPAITSHFAWLTIEQLVDYGQPGGAVYKDGNLATTNIRTLTVARRSTPLTIDGQAVATQEQTSYERVDGKWSKTKLDSAHKSSRTGGPFKNAFQNRFVLCYGTHGTPDENRWSYNKARFDSETWYYRGNGAVDIRSDDDLGDVRGRNVVLYGNPRTNGAFAKLVDTIPANAQVSGDRSRLVVFPKKGDDGLVAIVGADTMTGMRSLDRLPIFTSGVAYPDWTIFESQVGEKGTKGIVSAGFFDANWK
jgi:pimeloyl-ACP methyl ester carboxylesterase